MVMEKEIQDGKFLESASVHVNLYGTSIEAVDVVSDAGKVVYSSQLCNLERLRPYMEGEEKANVVSKVTEDMNEEEVLRTWKRRNIRRDISCWLARFAGKGTNNIAELLALKEALLYAKDHPQHFFVIESDSSLVVALANKHTHPSWQFSTILQDCWALQQHCEVEIKHVHRQCNTMADAIAAWGSQSCDGSWLYSLPPKLQKLLSLDMRGFANPRWIWSA